MSEAIPAEVVTEEAPAPTPAPAPEKKEAIAVVQENQVAGTGMWADNNAFRSAMQMAKVLSTAPMIPQNYRNEPGNCLIALDMAQRMNMPPMMIMQNLYIVNGNPGWSGQACIALVNNHGRFTPLKFIEKQEGDDFSCQAYATEIATGETVYGTTVDKKMAKDCGWLDKSGSYWKKMPMQMARYRAAAFFARAYCPESLMGLYTDDELKDIHGYAKED